MRCRPDEDAGKLLRRALRKSALVHMHAHMHVRVHAQVLVLVQVQVQVCSCVVCTGPKSGGRAAAPFVVREHIRYTRSSSSPSASPAPHLTPTFSLVR